MHEVNEITGKASLYTYYQCAYFGVAGSSTFAMSVTGLEENLEEANQWAIRGEDKVGATNLGNIGN